MMQLMKTTSPIVPIFRSEGLARVLATVFLEEAPLSLVDIADRTGVTPSTVYREVERLEQAGLVRSERAGRSRLIHPDADSPYHAEIRALLLKVFGPVAVLRRELDGVEGLEEAHIFGSWAGRYLGEAGPSPMDVDVVLVGEVDPDRAYGACRSAEDQLGVEVNPVVVSRDDWDEAETGFLRDIRSGPLVAVVEPH